MFLRGFLWLGHVLLDRVATLRVTHTRLLCAQYAQPVSAATCTMLWSFHFPVFILTILAPSGPRLDFGFVRIRPPAGMSGYRAPTGRGFLPSRILQKDEMPAAKYFPYQCDCVLCICKRVVPAWGFQVALEWQVFIVSIKCPLRTFNQKSN